MTRDEHLAWCKQRALALLEKGNLAGAVASMVSDLNKWDRPLYSHQNFMMLAAAGLLCKTAVGVRSWIEGFQ